MFNWITYAFNSVYSHLFCSQLYFTTSNISVLYDEKKCIGEGAFSTVLKATVKYNCSQEFALKKVIMQSVELERIIAIEIEALKKFKHTNLIEMIDYVEIDSSTCKVMYILFPLAANGNLRQKLNNIMNNKIPRPSLFEVLKDFLDICIAINVLHNFSPNYVHQDIKPEVICIMKNDYNNIFNTLFLKYVILYNVE
jgi:serine/threonine protein kinase